MSLIQSLWNLVVDTIGAVLTLVGVLLSNLWDLLLVLHMESPRLEGLLIGVTLACVGICSRHCRKRSESRYESGFLQRFVGNVQTQIS